jgi:hypothetical protein
VYEEGNGRIVGKSMGNLDGLEKWIQQEVEDNFQHNKFYYFTREMNVGSSCLKSYRSHIFVQIYHTQRELEDNWKEANHYIALKYQCKLEEIIEKSNFYLCLFVKGKVNLKIRNEIEGNSFCAKKYIFEESGGDLEDCLRCVENKIFRINISVIPKQFPMLESMVLQNFRGYAGKFTVNLQNVQKKAASFVVIFAKNGVGKTSFFDGVEFALKGEVGRIIDLALKDKNVKYRDAIYHNRDNADKDAFILMKLDDGRIIERRVSDISEERNDMRANIPIHGKEITGTQTNKEKWDQIILPHDKIDSFISAKSTTAQYKEWVKSVEPLKQETEAFEKSYSVYRKEQRTHNELKDSYDDIEKKLKGLSDLKNSVNKIYELIKQYNSMVSDKHSLYFTKDADVEQYDKLLNCIKRNIRRLDDRMKSLDSNIILAREILNKGVSSCYEVIKSVDKLKESLQVLDNRIRRRRELDVLLEENSENTLAVNNNQKELELLQNMVNYGIEEIQDKNKTYCNIGKKINELKETLDYFETELMKATETVNKLEVKRRKLKNSQLTSDKYEEALKKIKGIERNNIELKDLQEKNAAASDRSRQHQRSIVQIYDKIEKISAFILPKDIKELKLKRFQISAMI